MKKSKGLWVASFASFVLVLSICSRFANHAHESTNLRFRLAIRDVSVGCWRRVHALIEEHSCSHHASLAKGCLTPCHRPLRDRIVKVLTYTTVKFYKLWRPNRTVNVFLLKEVGVLGNGQCWMHANVVIVLTLRWLVKLPLELLSICLGWLVLCILLFYGDSDMAHLYWRILTASQWTILGFRGDKYFFIVSIAILWKVLNVVDILAVVLRWLRFFLLLSLRRSLLSPVVVGQCDCLRKAHAIVLSFVTCLFFSLFFFLIHFFAPLWVANHDKAHEKEC